MEATKFIWMDGTMLPWSDANVHVMSHGLHYGLGVFEGIRCHESPRGPAIFRLKDHIRRLQRSAKIYLIPMRYSAEELAGACREVVRANGLSDCYLRVIVHPGYGPRTPLEAPTHTAIACGPEDPTHGPEAAETGVRAKVASFQRIGPNVIPPAVKATGGYLNSYLAKVEAVTSGYAECISLNDAGYVTEGSAQNVFVVRDSVLATPPPSSGALAGITRDTIMVLARRLGYEVLETNLVRSDLYLADEVVFTGTRAGIVPVNDVDMRVVGDGSPGPVARALQAEYANAVNGGIDEFAHWLDPVAE